MASKKRRDKLLLYRKDADQSDKLSVELGTELHGHVLRIQEHDWLSWDWFGLAPSLRYITAVALLECEERDVDAATLWESKELACHYVLEERRVNVLLRLVAEHARQQRARELPHPGVAEAGERCGVDGAGVALSLIHI
eukprot:TRINITY_DN31041_c0_g1_i1.p3 TRINITY_DN31041_c0_g1~~TRINITY_DN31041_c0_g1_i1.p3  ORF type:complete len:139 (-),score=46.34 TRINITY_DN31041_c0_g1_i1:154-570(-)